MDKSALYKQIGSEIRKARAHKALTQEELAELIGKSPQYISDLERGVVGCSVNALRDLCSVLGLSSDQVLFGHPSSSVAGLVNYFGDLDDQEAHIASNIMSEILSLYRAGNKDDV